MVLNPLLLFRMLVVLERYIEIDRINRKKPMWNKRKDCLRMKESVGWTSSRLTVRLLDFKRPQLNRAELVLTGHCNLQRHKKTTGRAESFLCPKCSLEDRRVARNSQWGGAKLGIWGRSPQSSKILHFFFAKIT